MGKKCKNEYKKIDDELAQLTITKLDGTKHPVIIDSKNTEKMKACQCHSGVKGYPKSGKLNIAEIIMYPKKPGFVWNHKNGLKGDNRESNLEHVPDRVNKLMKKRKGKKDLLPDGIFSYTLKNGETRYKVRNFKNIMKAGFKTLKEALDFRFMTLVKKGANPETARCYLGMMTRKEYDEYWKIYNLLHQ
jgi:hypothetical protein